MRLFTKKVNEDNFASALDYLSLLWDEREARAWVEKLRKARVVQKRANDLVRASGSAPWSWDDPGVRRSLLKVLEGGRLHPPMVVSLDAELVIADGSHRISLAYSIDPFMYIPTVVAS